MMVVTLGALQSIPRDLEQAASVDGASGWQRFWHITLPLLKPALLPRCRSGLSLDIQHVQHHLSGQWW